MQYQSTLIAVKDVRKSLAFYQRWFDVEVEMDLGWNIALKGGLCLQEHFAELLGLLEGSVVERSHNMELYFECDDLDIFAKRLAGDQSIQYVHPLKEHAWRQRVLRIYDPDHHIIEIGETMTTVFKRVLAEGHSLEETAKITQFPVAYVSAATGITV